MKGWVGGREVEVEPVFLTHGSVRVPGLPDGEHPPVSLVLHGGHLHSSHQGGHGHCVARTWGHT